LAKSSEQEKKRKEDYTYTYMRIRSHKTNKAFPNRFDLYIPSELLEPFKKGLDAFRIHGGSASKKICEFVIRYGEVHGKGNPQLVMETFTNADAPSPVRVLCWSNLAGVTNEGKVYCRKHGGTWIQGVKCYSCPNNQLRKKSGL
jgi:hypothetical protein